MPLDRDDDLARGMPLLEVADRVGASYLFTIQASDARVLLNSIQRDPGLHRSSDVPVRSLIGSRRRPTLLDVLRPRCGLTPSSGRCSEGTALKFRWLVSRSGEPRSDERESERLPLQRFRARPPENCRTTLQAHRPAMVIGQNMKRS